MQMVPHHILIFVLYMPKWQQILNDLYTFLEWVERFESILYIKIHNLLVLQNLVL